MIKSKMEMEDTSYLGGDGAIMVVLGMLGGHTK